MERVQSRKETRWCGERRTASAGWVSHRFFGRHEFREAPPERHKEPLRSASMDPAVAEALEHIEFAEAELAILKQEQVLRELVRTEEPTAEAIVLLRELQAGSGTVVG